MRRALAKRALAKWTLAWLLLANPVQARIVSLNVCTDQLLMLLAPEQVAALSILSRDPALSVVAEQAALVPVVRADAEAVLRLAPTLVLAGQYGAQATLAALERRGVPVLRVALPESFEAVRLQVTTVAAALGVPERGAALIATMDAALSHPAVSRRRALVWGARGWTSGPGTFTDAVLSAAGLDNAARGGMVGLEALLAHPPDLLVTATAPRTPSMATELLRHPALDALPRRTLPPAWLLCAGPWSAQAVHALAAP